MKISAITVAETFASFSILRHRTRNTKSVCKQLPKDRGTLERNMATVALHLRESAMAPACPGNSSLTFQLGLPGICPSW